MNSTALLLNDVAKQVNINHAMSKAFPGHFDLFMNAKNRAKQLADMIRFYPPEYIEGVKSQIR